MVINLPEEYIVQKFFQYAGSPKYNKYNKTYQGYYTLFCSLRPIKNNKLIDIHIPIIKPFGFNSKGF